MFKLTIVVTIFLDLEKSLEIVKKISSKATNQLFNILVINDNPKIQLNSDNINVLNSKVNYGKFWTIINAIKTDYLKSDYFLTIDPDDLLLDSIDFTKLNRLAMKIDLLQESFDYGVNSYKYIDHLLGEKLVKKNPMNIKVTFTPNLIYNTSNIIEYLKLTKIEFNDKKLTYFEDRLLLFLSYNEGKSKNFYKSFYTYNKNFGITKERQKYFDEIIDAKNLMNIILHSNVKIEKNYKMMKYNIDIINKYSNGDFN